MLIYRCITALLFYFGMGASIAEAQHRPEACPTFYRDFASYLEAKRRDAETIKGIDVTQEKLPGLKAHYAVEPDNTFRILTDNGLGDHTKIWDDLQKLSREPVSTFFSSVALYEFKERTVENAIAYVSSAGAKYQLSVDLAAISMGAQWDWALLHEFGHIMLGNFHVPPMFRVRVMLGVSVSLPTRDPFVSKYEKAFWTDCASRAREKSTYSFLTTHATKNMDEDLAESWVGFIVCEKPREDDERIVVAKKRMMWNEPALMERRTHIHTTFGAERLRAVRDAFPHYCAPLKS